MFCCVVTIKTSTQLTCHTKLLSYPLHRIGCAYHEELFCPNIGLLYSKNCKSRQKSAGEKFGWRWFSDIRDLNTAEYLKNVW